MSPITEELAELGELIRDLDDRIGTPEGLMREHLLAARCALVEASDQEELRLILDLAQETLPELDRPELVARVRHFLERYSKA